MLKDEHISLKVQNYMEILPDILQELVPDTSTLKDRLVVLYTNHYIFTLYVCIMYFSL